MAVKKEAGAGGKTPTKAEAKAAAAAEKAAAKAAAEKAKADAAKKAAAEKAKAAAEKAKLEKAKAVEAAKKEKEKALAAKKAEAEKAKKQKEEEKAKAKAEREAKAAAKKAEKEAAKNREPDPVTQINEKGEPEVIDRNKFPFPVECAFPGCTEVRYVTQSGLREVTMCKLHARKERRKRRALRLRDRDKNYALVVKDALERGLFPDDFKAKHGL